MQIRRILTLQVIKMSSQLTQSFASPVFLSQKSIVTMHNNNNPYHTLLRNACFHITTPLSSTKLTYPFHNSMKTHHYHSRHKEDPSTRLSRSARIEAQQVLFDYLHSTRNLDFVDAEHISKNSPNFIDKLLSKVKDDEEVTRSLTRFLRYHPINEFEPFFESLGLTTAELPEILPRDLMFLNDDDMLLENFHVLCNYGIPRNKIGKIYKEAPGIFKDFHGVLSSKLQAYQELGLSNSTVIKLVICCPMIFVGGGVNEDFGKVLGKLKGLEIESDWIRCRLRDENTYNWGRICDMMCFLDEMGCDRKEMGRLFKTHPGFLFEDSGKKFYILVALLLKLGLKGEEILLLFVHYPRILVGRSVKSLWEIVNFLSVIGMETDDIAKIIRTHTQILGHCPLRKPVTVMSRLKVGPDRLCEIIKEDPLGLIDLASKSKNKSTKKVSTEGGGHLLEKITFLKGIGFIENSEDMVKALNRFRGRGDQLQERFDCLVNAGLDCHVVSNMIKAAPPVLNLSKEVIKMKIEYLVNQLGYPLESLVAFPTYLCYDIEKIKLRFSMYSWLKEEGAANPMLSLSTILACSDARFVNYFVKVHPKAQSVWESLKSSSSSI